MLNQYISVTYSCLSNNQKNQTQHCGDACSHRQLIHYSHLLFPEKQGLFAKSPRFHPVHINTKAASTNRRSQVIRYYAKQPGPTKQRNQVPPYPKNPKKRCTHGTKTGLRAGLCQLQIVQKLPVLAPLPTRGWDSYSLASKNPVRITDFAAIGPVYARIELAAPIIMA